MDQDSPDALIVGAGPAGLIAADALAAAGLSVLIADHKPSVARKFLMAGKSGLNLTKDEPFETFVAAYGPAAADLRPMLESFPPSAVRGWAEGLGQPCFTGSTGRVFPVAMKASPLLRAWAARLGAMGVMTRTRWRWTGWDGAACTFDTPEGARALTPKVTVLALGGASWARLGSDGGWAQILGRDGIALAPFSPANAGLLMRWSAHMTQHLGAPLKGIAWHAGALTSRGEAVISARGLEGGGLYPLTPALRDGAPLSADLAPDLPPNALIAKLSKPRGKQSLSNHLRKQLPLDAQTRALLMECARPLPSDPQALAKLLKALPIPYAGLRPLDEAISTAGGLPFAALDQNLMLTARPGTFCAGEMLDWEAPTGGYLLNACLATGLWAGQAAARFVS
ncbi:TIGR03862 family flavoprotein [Citreicella sp. C3M06]|uniref:TIGR03862 family flavoprotein n=1 Tax=Citreicella sp. C3M06 TaxID=2841564 RepID=UPI001C084241|nr:TIGR03862 family flavoprotein [Citreicella sp. C3M06]MBU2962590.1 TIGR03862 family flavoprotein [Citreicella sp. C3M06]